MMAKLSLGLKVVVSLTICICRGGDANTALEDRNRASEITASQLANFALDEQTVFEFPIIDRDGNIEYVDISKEISTYRSEEFGRQLLGMEMYDDVEKIRTEENPQSAIKQIIKLWFEGGTENPVTCRFLAKVLHNIGLIDRSNDIRTTCEYFNFLDEPYRPRTLKRYYKQLSEIYEREPVFETTLFLPKKLRERKIRYVDLEMEEKGATVSLSEFLDSVQEGNRVLFLGRPGVGKTTVTRYMTKILLHDRRFYLVVKIHLRGLLKRIDSLVELLKVCGDESFQSDSIKRISEYIETKVGAGVIFLLDGYDDYHEPSNYIHDLLKKFSLKKAIVILTSRPTAVENIKGDFDRQIEIIGIGNASIRSYLEEIKLPEAKRRIINHYLSIYPNVRQSCYLPLHLSMLVYVTLVTENDDPLSVIDTETILYMNFLTLTIRQNEERYTENTSSLRNCLYDVDSETNLCIIFRKIYQLSFEGLMPGMRKNALVSTSFNELPANLNISAKLEEFSLFKVVPIDDSDGARLYKYYYSHPTFQELFAALHLTTLPRNERLSYVQHASMYEVYKFFLGIIGNKNAKNYDSEYLSRTFVSFTVESVYRDYKLYIIKCAHQTGQNFVSLLKAAGVITESNSLTLDVNALMEQDCWYIGHVLLRSPLYKLDIEAIISEKLASCISVIEDYFKLYEHEILDIVDVKHLAVGPKIIWLSLTAVREDAGVMTVMSVMNFLSVFEKRLKLLELTFMMFKNNKSVLLLADALKSFDNLTSLALLVHIDVLEMTLKNLPSLNHLKLGVVFNNGPNNIPSNLFQFRNMRNIKSLTLALIGNITGSVNMTSLFGELRHLTNLQSLSIICRFCEFYNATELLQRIKRVSVPELALDIDFNLRYGGMVSVLSKMTNLRNLSLYIEFDFHGARGNTGVKELVEGLKSLVDLQVLHLLLSWKLLTNESINEGVEAIVNALKQFHGLKVLELILIHNGTTGGIASLFPSLPHLQELQLTLIDDKTNVKVFLNGIKHLKHLKKLDLSGNDITDEDVPSLLDALKYLNLSILDLSHNKIDDTGLELLAKAIETGYLSSLQVLQLGNNKYSDTGADILSQKIGKLSELRTFVLRDHERYNTRAKIQIYQERAIRRSELKQHKESNASSSLADIEPWIGACIFGGILFVMGFVAAFRYPGTTTDVPQHIISSNALAALTTSSASFFWKLRKSPGNDLDGTGTNIAILDSAVYCQYATLLGKQITSIDCFLPTLSNRFYEHGTLCASIAIGSAAQIDETTFIYEGVAPRAACFAYRVTERNICFSEAVLRALDDIEMKIRDGNIQIDVVSISLDITDNQDEIEQKILSLTRRKVVFVAAAGNFGRHAVESCFPARLKSVISVGALDKNGRKSKFNSCGRIDVYAVGEDIPLAVTTETTEKTQTKAKTGTTARAGTSFATPAIAGLVLLLKQLANKIGSPACDHIHRVEILRRIFKEDMRVTSGSGKVLPAPGVFLERVTSRPEELNEMVRRHLRTLGEGAMEIG